MKNFNILRKKIGHYLILIQCGLLDILYHFFNLGDKTTTRKPLSVV